MAAPNAHLSFREVQGNRQLFPLLPHHILILLEGLLELQELGGAEGRANPFRLAEGKEEAGIVWAWKGREKTVKKALRMSFKIVHVVSELATSNSSSTGDIFVLWTV